MNHSGTAPMPQVAGVTHHRLPVGDLEMHVVEAGAGTPVVLLHGAPQHWYEWRDVLTDLAADHRAIAPDLRGCGWTSVTDGGYDIDSQVADVLGLLDALDLERAHLVGNDYGVIIGWQLAFDHPDRIAGFVAAAGTHPWTRGSLRMVGQLWRLWFQPVLSTPGLGPLTARFGNQGLARFMLDYVHPMTPEAVEAFLAPLREPERARALSAIYRQLILPAMGRMVRGSYDGRRLQVPSRVLLGGDDPMLTEAELGPWRGTADSLSVATIAGAAHFLASERPDAVAAAVRELTAAGR